MQYPLAEDSDSNPFTHTRDAHEAFLRSRSDTVIGRGDVLHKVSLMLLLLLLLLLLCNSDNDDNSKLLICHLLLCHSVSPFGVMVTVLDLQFKSCGFDSWPFCCQVMTLGKLITHMPLPPSSRNWYQSNTGGAL